MTVPGIDGPRCQAVKQKRTGQVTLHVGVRARTALRPKQQFIDVHRANVPYPHVVIAAYLENDLIRVTPVGLRSRPTATPEAIGRNRGPYQVPNLAASPILIGTDNHHATVGRVLVESGKHPVLERESPP